MGPLGGNEVMSVMMIAEHPQVPHRNLRLKICCRSVGASGHNKISELHLTILPNLVRRTAAALLAIGLLPAAHGVAHAADDAANAANLRAVVDAAIRPVMAEHDVPGMAVAITINGRASFFNYGVASKETNTPVTENTLFEIGSISKIFTATLATYAQAMGKLALNDHPSQHWPALKGSAIDRASLMHLGTYTAGGLPLQFPDAVSNDKLLDYFVNWKPVAKPGTKPGTQRAYSNPSVGLLGHVTALALKTGFVDAMQSQLFPKLGLQHSHIKVSESEMANYAWGHNKAQQAIRVNPGVLDAQAYGVKSSAADMIRFVQLNIDPSRLPPPLQRAVRGTHVGYFKVGDMVQGLGWEQYAYPVSLERLLAGHSTEMVLDPNAAKAITPPAMPVGPTLFNKTGSTGGFGSYVAFVPEKGIGVVVMGNRNWPVAARVRSVHAILEGLAGKAKAN
jgi:beta-lactamase class C